MDMRQSRESTDSFQTQSFPSYSLLHKNSGFCNPSNSRVMSIKYHTKTRAKTKSRVYPQPANTDTVQKQKQAPKEKEKTQRQTLQPPSIMGYESFF